MIELKTRSRIKKTANDVLHDKALTYSIYMYIEEHWGVHIVQSSIREIHSGTFANYTRREQLLNAILKGETMKRKLTYGFKFYLNVYIHYVCIVSCFLSLDLGYIYIFIITSKEVKTSNGSKQL